MVDRLNFDQLWGLAGVASAEKFCDLAAAGSCRNDQTQMPRYDRHFLLRLLSVCWPAAHDC
jgi:hypothetical protein